MIGYGPIMSIKLFQNSGYGFVYFKNENDAKNALTNLNGKDFNGRKKNIFMFDIYFYAFLPVFFLF